MLKNFLLILVTLIILSFFYTIINHYLSDTNKRKVNLNRINFTVESLKILPDIIILKNDTKDSIEFNSGFNEIKKNKLKRNFWELLKK
tara:strand:+ start:287 stop:550 length:264 start_codon:yes stop_codon:yes gene_type:complete